MAAESPLIKIEMGMDAQGYYQFEAINRVTGKPNGYLKFERRSNESGLSYYNLMAVAVSIPGQRIGTSLVRAFSESIHPSQITYDILHKPTIAQLKSRVITDPTQLTFLEINDPDLINELSLCRLFKYGGIGTDLLQVITYPKEIPPFNFLVSAYGQSVD